LDCDGAVGFCFPKGIALARNDLPGSLKLGLREVGGEMAMISCDEVGVNGLGILPTSLGGCHEYE